MDSSIKISSANANYIKNTTANKIVKETPTNISKADGNKKLKLALAGLAAVGSAAVIGIGILKKKNTIEDAKKFFDKHLKTTQGNNKALNEAIEESKISAQKFFSENKNTAEEIKNYISSVINPIKIEDVAKDGYVYHGTKVESAKSILENGITPYFSKKGGNSLPGLGRGVYTTPTLDLASKYSSNGVVLPFKVEGNVAELTTDMDKLRENIATKIALALEPNSKHSMFFTTFSNETNEKALNYTPDIINYALQDMGYSGLYTKTGITKGFITSLFNEIENIETMGQLAIFNGEKLTLDMDKLKELNPINKNNFEKFLI